MRGWVTCLSFFISFLIQNTYSSTIRGVEPAYAGEVIYFFTYTDPVSKSVKEIFRLKIEKDGSFNAKTDTRDITFAFSDFGIYKGLLFIQPGKEITLHLPPRKDKSVADEKNPYFSPFSTWLMTDEPSAENLNRIIPSFDSKYFQLSDKYFNQLYARQSRAYFDTIANLLSGEFGPLKNPLFRNHMLLKIKLLEGDVTRQNREKIFEKISLAQPYPWLHPAFIETLESVFNNRLSFEARSVKGDNIKKAVAGKDLAFLRKFCEENYRTVEPVTSIVLLKLLYDAFYSGDFSKDAILSMVSSAYFSNHTDASVRIFSSETLRKLKFLLPGTPAPVICLNNVNGEKSCSDRLISNYLYLFFADVEIPVCQEQLKYLKKVYEKYRGRFDLFIVLYPTNQEKINGFIKTNQIPGTIVIDEKPMIFSKKYNVKSFPTGFLIDKNHNTVLAPAKTPLDGFEQQLGSILQADRINSLRKSEK
jgi:peroxiredoxin